MYKEPELTIAVPDFKRSVETKLCLESIKTFVKFPVKVIYYHNGNSETYPYDFFKRGLCDLFVQSKKNEGGGIITRDLYQMTSSPYIAYIQNDQYLRREWTLDEFNLMVNLLGTVANDTSLIIKSISLRGSICGHGIYSEVCNFFETEFYRKMEKEIPFNHAGPGPYHFDGPWREELIIKYYKENNFTHYTKLPPLLSDNGHRAVRQNPDGSIWEHQPDRKGLRLIKGPVKEKYLYPMFTDEEWEGVLKTQIWEDWKIPSREVKDSFHVWN